MQIGIHLPHIGRKAGPDAIRRAAVQAEELGFADVWVSEHIIIPKGAPYPPSPNFWDPVLTLTWAAAYTQRVKLGTSVLVLPMRHPLPLAKELATLQNLSQGRLILGAGVGWMEAEFDALGVPFRERGRRMDEGIAMMKAVWSDDPVTFPTRWIPAEDRHDAHAAQAVRADPDLDRRFVGCGDRACAAAGWLARQPRDTGAGAGDGAAAARRPAGCGVHHLAAHAVRDGQDAGVARQAGGIQGGRRAACAGGAGGARLEEYLAAVERVARCAEGM